MYGLAQSGSWCCLDELNRVGAEVLAALATQMFALKAALDSRSVRWLREPCSRGQPQDRVVEGSVTTSGLLMGFLTYFSRLKLSCLSVKETQVFLYYNF